MPIINGVVMTEAEARKLQMDTAGIKDYSINGIRYTTGNSNKSLPSMGSAGFNDTLYKPQTTEYTPMPTIAPFNYNEKYEPSKMKEIAPFEAPTYTRPTIGTAPTYQEPQPYYAPTFQAPEYSEAKVNALTQEQSAPAIRGLRSAVQRISASGGENQNANRMTLREALAGYGQGLQSALSGAAASARNMYNTEYGIKADSAKTNFMAKETERRTNYSGMVDAAKTNFNAQYDKYKMDWESLNDESKTNYVNKFQAAMANYNTQADINKTNFLSENDARKTNYLTGADVAKTNYLTNADMMKTDYLTRNSINQSNTQAINQAGITNYQGNLNKQMAEYDAAVKDYMQNTKTTNSVGNVGVRRIPTIESPSIYG